MKATNYPEGTTHVYTYKSTVEYYKRIGTSSFGYPTFVRWIKSKNAWAKTALAFDHVNDYAEEI